MTEKNMFFLYCIKPNPKEIVYIGITQKLERRKGEHKKKYPNCQFEVIAVSYSEFWIRKLEELLIENYSYYVENKQHNFLNKNLMGSWQLNPSEKVNEFKEIEFKDQFEGGEWMDK